MYKKTSDHSAGISLSPTYLLVIMIASIFSAEAVVMLTLSLLSPLSAYKISLLDPLMLTIILFPVVYFLVFRPFKSHVAEHKQSEEALQASEAKYRSLVEMTDDSIYLVNANCEYLFMNNKHRTRLGYIGDEYIGKPYSKFHSPEETDIFAKKVRTVLETGKPLQHEHRSLRDNTYFLRTLSPIGNVQGETVAVSVISKNITTLKHAEIEREKLVAELQDATAKIRTLKGLIPVCSWCRKVRDDKGYWNQLETYIREHTDADFTHGICADCMDKLKSEEGQISED